MPEMSWEVPADSDWWPCPEGCGGGTEDPCGGPCSACWEQITRRERGEDDEDA